MNDKPLVVFAHGKESGPWGSKIRYFADIAQKLGVEVLSPDYSDLVSPDDRVKRLVSLPLPTYSKLLLVGSSMGGYVSLLASRQLKPVGLFLMAPALYLPGYSEQDPAPVADQICIVHGWNDSIIPVEHSFRFAKNHHAELHVIEGDHRLNGALEQLGDLFQRFSIKALGDSVSSEK
jgi:pimeloyl-ACP methyl ester carboxylesterase